MRELKLYGKYGEGKVTKVDASDYEALSKYRWQVSPSGYVVRTTNRASGREAYRVHRVVIGANPGEIVDHLNGDKLDNRRGNLRICTSSENSLNRKKAKNYCYTKGRYEVYWKRKKYGTYDTEEEAKRAVQLVKSGGLEPIGVERKYKYLPKYISWHKTKKTYNVYKTIDGVLHQRAGFRSLEDAVSYLEKLDAQMTIKEGRKYGR